MMHEVKKPFGWYPDGFTREALDIGDKRDFGAVTAGLVAEGYIVAPKQARAPVAASVAPVADEVAVEKPRRGRKRTQHGAEANNAANDAAGDAE